MNLSNASNMGAVNWGAFIGPATDLATSVIDKIGGRKTVAAPPPPPPKPEFPIVPVAIGGGLLMMTILVVAMKK